MSNPAPQLVQKLWNYCNIRQANQSKLKRQGEGHMHDIEQIYLGELKNYYAELKRTHAGRAKRPLKFVELFEEADIRMPSLKGTGWASVEKEHGYVTNLLERFRSDYVNCLSAAQEQREKNQLWDLMYGDRPKIYEGGRADGNSR